jgi:hypothetical protein
VLVVVRSLGSIVLRATVLSGVLGSMAMQWVSRACDIHPLLTQKAEVEGLLVGRPNLQ